MESLDKQGSKIIKDFNTRLCSIEDKIDSLFGIQTPTQYMTVKQLAAYLNKSKSWIYHQVSDGTIPVLRDPSGLRFRREEIDAWMQKSFQEPVVKPKSEF
ncbi:MAG: helix-turn-helix domain-containing protein [Calditrichaeota bacterium]|nr:helix-turn-helix domain-containing protein [Calditrichota bacterium]